MVIFIHSRHYHCVQQQSAATTDTRTQQRHLIAANDHPVGQMKCSLSFQYIILAYCMRCAA